MTGGIQASLESRQESSEALSGVRRSQKLELNWEEPQTLECGVYAEKVLEMFKTGTWKKRICVLA